MADSYILVAILLQFQSKDSLMLMPTPPSTAGNHNYN